jgi:uncharacterized OsmC-like protein
MSQKWIFASSDASVIGGLPDSGWLPSTSPGRWKSMQPHIVQIEVTYEGQLRTKATHGPSGNSLFTDAPVDNHGRGESFSPTDLVATALGTCMATVMGIFAGRHSIDLRGMRVTVKKGMTQTPVRRIGSLPTEILVPLPGITLTVRPLNVRRSRVRSMPACIRMWRNP